MKDTRSFSQRAAEAIASAPLPQPEWMRKGCEFTAMYRGKRGNFVAVEHHNFGNGWWCWDMGDRLSGCVSSTEMRDFHMIGYGTVCQPGATNLLAPDPFKR